MKKIALLSIAALTLFVLGGCDSFKKTTAEEAQPEEQIPAETEEVTPPEEEKTEEKTEEPAADNPKTATPTPAPKKEEPKVETPKSEVKTFNMTAKQFSFTPSTITVNEGDTVRINLNSTDVTHGLAIPDFGVNKVAPAGSTVTAEFVAGKKGTFQFRCSVFCGQDHPSMTGTLVVK